MVGRIAISTAETQSEVPIVQEGPLSAAGAHDQTDRNARDHALSLGASGRGE